jgi:hypothetical protein
MDILSLGDILLQIISAQFFGRSSSKYQAHKEFWLS